MLDKTYTPADIEARIAERWDDAGAFKAGAGINDWFNNSRLII